MKIKKIPDAKNDSVVIEMTESEYREAEMLEVGYCLGCGAEHDGVVEPDARGYKCDECGSLRVHGLELALAMGRIVITE